MKAIEKEVPGWKRRPVWFIILLAVICAMGVAIGRLREVSLVIIGDFTFAYTDIFVLVASGIGGLGCGILSFSLSFIWELYHVAGDFTSFYAMVTYLVLVLAASVLSYKGWFSCIKKMFFADLVLASALAFCWMITFKWIMPAIGKSNMFSTQPFWKLFLCAFPEAAISSGINFLFFRYAPEWLKRMTDYGWVYLDDGKEDDGGWKILGTKVTLLSLAEALILSLVAMLCYDLFTASAEKTNLSLSFMKEHWNDNLRMIFMIMSAAVPVSYLFNLFIMRFIVHPIKAMSILMDRYFEMDEKNRTAALPELDIHSGDEVERLYQSLQKMVGDMYLYIDRMVEQEKKTTHMTKGFMLALAKAVDAKDRYTSGHSVRVAQYAREIAKRMNKTEEEQEDIYIMGLLHDIGKIGVPEAIINKNGRLTDEEFAKIKEHPKMGADILQFVEELPQMANGARWHHERYDGRGYPDGLAGEEIPEEARIIAVADAYDAMTSNRAYSKVRPQEEVRSEIVRCSGTQFDPVMAGIMVQMIDDDKEYKMHE